MPAGHPFAREHAARIVGFDLMEHDVPGFRACVVKKRSASQRLFSRVLSKHHADPKRSRHATRTVFSIVALVFVLMTGNTPCQTRPPSGIPALDSLPVYDWGIPEEPLSIPLTVGLSAVFPGGGQFYSGHPVRGSFLLGLEAILAGLSITSYTVDLPRRDREISRNLDSADAAALRWAQDPDDDASRDALEDWIRAARRNQSLRRQYADLANSQLAWAAGLHVYGMTDALEIALRSHEPIRPARSVRRAFVYGLVFPGGGQFYNDRYGKFGMLWMALGASAVSAWSRQEMVHSLNESIAVARVENAQGYATDLSQLELDRTLYRRKRNQYYWGSALLYVYAIMDGMVDAAISDFDRPNRYAIGPGLEPLSFVATVSF